MLVFNTNIIIVVMKDVYKIAIGIFKVHSLLGLLLITQLYGNQFGCI